MKTLKKLVEELSKSDSISLKRELEDDIYTLCKNHLAKKIKICEKYKVSEFGNRSLLGVDLDCDYRVNSGGFYRADDYYESGYVILHYHASWARGGECDFAQRIPFATVDGFNEKEFEERVIDYKIFSVEEKITLHKEEIKKLKESITQFKKEI